jgi:hypothetical protein
MNAVPRLLRGGRARVALVAVAIVAFAFWRALFAGGSLVSADIVATAPPIFATKDVSFEAEGGPGDPINIHSHWASLAADVRSGDVAWWDPDLGGGQPTFKGGFPPFDLLYLLVPAWFAPGLVAAVRTLTALGLTAGWLRLMGTGRVAALVGGIAFAFSGFMVGWMNWPHSSVAAIAPGLLWAAEAAIRDPRVWRAVPIGLALSAMLWSNFPAVTYYLLIAVAVYAVIRVATEPSASAESWKSRLTPPVMVAGVALAVAVTTALPHIVGFSEYLDWAETSQRVGNPIESWAGTKYLLTAFTPVAFGSDAVGPAWFGEGNWTEFEIYTGVSVVVLAAVGTALIGDRRRQAAVAALVIIAALGVVIAYVGGPVSIGVQKLAGDQIGLATRAKVLVSLGVALLAGLGADVWSREWDDRDRREVVRALKRAAIVLSVAGLALVPSVMDWLDMARQAGASRQVVAHSIVPLIAGLAVLSILVARWRRRLSGPGTAWAIVGVVAFELLSFAMPVPTTAHRDQRLSETDAHRQVEELLEPGERLAGEGRAFFPNTTELFDIDDARGQVLKSAGYQALLREVDPVMLQSAGGGTPTNPNVAFGTDPSSPAWDVMAVGVWAQFNSSLPPGELEKPGVAKEVVDPVLAPVSGTIRVPEGGLRAVVFEVFVRGIPKGRLHVSVDVDGDVRKSIVDTSWVQTGFASAAFVGEDLPAGAIGRVTLSAEGPVDQTLVAVDERGELTLGTVAGGDDGLSLVRAGDVTLLERSAARFARLSDAAVVLADAEAAAGYIVESSGPRPVAVDRDVGLPADIDPDAVLEVESVEFDPGSIRIRTSSDRPALLVVSQNHYPGWTAEVDGAEAEIVTADASFMGVIVPSGGHTVGFGFQPRHVAVTSAIALIGLVASVVLIGRARRSGLPSKTTAAR